MRAEHGAGSMAAGRPAVGAAPAAFGDRAAASVNEVEAGTDGRKGSDATAGDLVVADRR